MVQAAEAAAQKANKRANFFKPQGKKSSQSTKARSSPDARPSDVADAPVAADKRDDLQGEAVDKQPTELELDCGKKNDSSKSSNTSTSLAAASSATTFNNPPASSFQLNNIVANFDEDDDAVTIDDEDGNWPDMVDDDTTNSKTTRHE